METSAQNSKIILQDTAILRVKENVYFDSDLKEIFNMVVKLDCLMGGSFLLEKIDMNPKKEKYPNLKKSNPGKHKEFYKKFLLLIQLRNFLKERSVNKNFSRIEKLVSPNKKLCGWKKSPILMELLGAEIFFQERFFLREKDSKGESSNSSIDESINLFFSTLEKRVEYHFYL